jgi:iron complex transport system substrate-binding protein
MEFNLNYNYPQKIICLTEESVETLYLLGKEELISGVSAFVKRPVEAQKLPKVSFFTSSNYKKILEIRPDLVIGHSDIQKDIARDLIEKGLNVFIANHRSLHEILQYIQMLSRLVKAEDEGDKLITRLLQKIAYAKKFTKSLQYRPKVYFEEWDEPMISAIKWVSELIELCGGVDINKQKSTGTLAKDRFVSHSDIIRANPDIIFGCWCGKKVKIQSIKTREGYSQINAVKNNQVFELSPEIFLQPGPAPILDGIDILIKYFKELNKGVLR